jgi:3-deoxy-7-phosphoheptulonate synthase
VFPLSNSQRSSENATLTLVEPMASALTSTIKVQHLIDDYRIRSCSVVDPPLTLEAERPISDAAASLVYFTRQQILKILSFTDRRLLVVVGPCSIHDTEAALEYASRLKPVATELAGDLLIVMRVYFEKPRTTVGWKGLINDPQLDESHRINQGLRLARNLLLDLAEMGVPAGSEFLDLITPQYLGALVSWGAIGARTTESQLHRQLVSGLSCPVGFKNGTSGDAGIAIEAILSARHPHTFLGHTKEGQTAIFATAGNPDCHLILRGGRGVTNYDAASVDRIAGLETQAGLHPEVMIDCSHANSRKDHARQPMVCRDVTEQIARGDRRIIGVMLESNLVAGCQQHLPGRRLVYGQSMTDACISWEDTVPLLCALAAARRAHR